MKQTITIVIDGTDGVLPESAGNVLRAVFSILKSMDVRSWKVQAARVRWRISDAQLVNPLTITVTGTEVDPSAGSPDLAPKFVQNLKQIESGKRPRDFTEDDFRYVKLIGAEAKRSRAIAFEGVNGHTESISVGPQFAKRVRKLVREPVRVRTEYGSLVGTLVLLANDPLKEDGVAKLRDKLGTFEVSCHADPKKATEMGHYLNRKSRIVVYGTITYENDVPRRVQVEDFAELPDENTLPSLEDLHALNLRLPNDMNPEDYLDDLRGDE